MGIRESLLNTITSVADSDFVRVVTAAGASSKATVANLFKSFESNLGAKSSLTTSDYIRVVGSDNEAYKQSVSDVKNSMGVTALESNMGSTLANGTDLNTLTLPANDRKIKIYHGQDITQMTNAPSAVSNAWPFCLVLVPIGTGGTYTKQILHIYGTTGIPNNVYVRTQTYTSGTTWTTWVQEPTRAEIDNCKVKWFEVSGTPNQYGSLAFPNDLETLWAQRRVTGFINASSQVALVNTFYSGGKHYFSCWNTQTQSAFTSSILIEVAYI